MLIIYMAIFLFGSTALMGMYLSLLVFLNKQRSKIVIAIHGLLTVSVFVLLLACYPASLKSMMYFFIATLCGLVLLYQEITGKKFSKWLCIAHGALTVIGFVFLVSLIG